MPEDALYLTMLHEISRNQSFRLCQFREAELRHDSGFELKLEFHRSGEDDIYDQI